MKMEEVLYALRHAPEHPLWGAVMEVVAAYREEAVQRAKDPVLTDKETNIALGAVTACDEIRENLESLLAKSRRDDGR